MVLILTILIVCVEKADIFGIVSCLDLSPPEPQLRSRRRHASDVLLLTVTLREFCKMRMESDLCESNTTYPAGISAIPAFQNGVTIKNTLHCTRLSVETAPLSFLTSNVKQNAR